MITHSSSNCPSFTSCIASCSCLVRCVCAFRLCVIFLSISFEHVQVLYQEKRWHEAHIFTCCNLLDGHSLLSGPWLETWYISTRGRGERKWQPCSPLISVRRNVSVCVCIVSRNVSRYFFPHLIHCSVFSRVIWTAENWVLRITRWDDTFNRQKRRTNTSPFILLPFSCHVMGDVMCLPFFVMWKEKSEYEKSENRGRVKFTLTHHLTHEWTNQSSFRCLSLRVSISLTPSNNVLS